MNPGFCGPLPIPPKGQYNAITNWIAKALAIVWACNWIRKIKFFVVGTRSYMLRVFFPYEKGSLHYDRVETTLTNYFFPFRFARVELKCESAKDCGSTS